MARTPIASQTNQNAEFSLLYRENRNHVARGAKRSILVLACVFLMGFHVALPVAAQDFQLTTDAYELIHDQVFESGLLSVLDNDLVLPEGRLVVSVTRPPDHGALEMRPDGTFAYTPDPGYLGDDSFEYVVELRPIQLLTFGPEEMALDVRAEVDLGTFGSDSDQQLVPVTGTVGIDIGPTGNPLTTVQLLELDVTNRDAIALVLDYGLWGTIKIDAAAEALDLMINRAGPAVELTGLGNFTQTGNKLGLDARVFIEGTGLISTQINPDFQDVVTETDIDFSGLLLKNDGTLTLILSVNSLNTFDLDGRSVEMDITGQISAVGPYIEGSASATETVNLSIISPAAVAENDTPGPFRLQGVYPNPVRDRATIELVLDRPTDVRVAIFDLLGREVEALPAGYLTSGRHTLQWDATTLPRGLYLLRVDADAKALTTPVLVQ